MSRGGPLSSDLHDRLEDLAAQTPVTAPPADLWDRGVRRRRLDRAVTSAVVLAVLTLVGLGGWTWHGSRTVQPTDTHGSPRLPDRLFRPSPWLSAFDGPPGRLVAVGVAERKSLLHTRQSVYGVTASGSAYGFLDLPGYVLAGDAGSGKPALSPDGRKVAYWISGAPSAKPTDTGLPATTGVSVYDAETGRTRSVRLSTAHGLMADALVWTDSRTLVIGFDQLLEDDPRDPGSLRSRPAAVQVWRLEQGDHADVLAAVDGLDPSSLAPGHGFVASQGSRRATLVWPRQPGRQLSFRAPIGRSAEGPVVSPGGDRVALVRGNRDTNRLWWGAVRPLPHGTPMRLATEASDYYLPLAWTDEDHVVALAATRPLEPAPEGVARVDLVEVSTGASIPLMDSVPGGGNVWELSVATDLLTAPSVHAAAPPRPWDPRLVLQLTALLLVVGFFVWGTRGRRA
jgi:hypothetical protein